MPNQKERLTGKVVDYNITVDSLEVVTGLDFFEKLDDSIEDRIESQKAVVWPIR